MPNFLYFVTNHFTLLNYNLGLKSTLDEAQIG